MLLEVGIMFGAYAGKRFYENRTKKLKPVSRNVKPIKSPQVSIKDAVIKDLDKQHYLKISVLSMGLAVMRRFYPPIAPLSLGIYIYTAFPFMKHVEKSLVEKKKVDIDVLFFTADTLTLAISQYFTAAFGVWMLYISRYLVVKAKGQSEKKLINVFAQQPNKVWVLKDNIEVEIPLEAVKLNDTVVVNTGEVIAVDGSIVEGMATIDQHALTGESQPAEKTVGDPVFASTIVISGRIGIRVEKSGQDTTIAKIEQILNRSVTFKSNIQLKGEQWANKATLPMLAMAGIILPLFGPTSTVVFINSHTGSTIRTFASLGTLNHVSIASHKGILVKDGRALEKLNQIDTVLFDKTGTLTDEQPKVVQIITCEAYDENKILTYAAAAERKFSHPIAKAILEKAQAFNLTLPDIDDSQYQMGYGITVNLENKVIRVGSVRFIKNEGITIPELIEETISQTEGYSLVLVAVNQQVSGAIKIQVQVRPEVKNMINGLRQRGIKHIAIVSGDQLLPTQKLAEELGMDNYFYEVLPENKAKIVEQLQAEGKSVCFVGDGINDAIAMKKANISISLHGATSIATDMAEVILMDGSLSHLCELFDISKNLENNLRNGVLITIIPGVINLGGFLLFHFTILTSLLVMGTFSTLAIGNAMLPYLMEISDKNG